MKQNWRHEDGWTVLRDGVEIAQLTYISFDNTTTIYGVERFGVSANEWLHICDTPQHLVFRNKGNCAVEITSDYFTMLWCVDEHHVTLRGKPPRTTWQQLSDGLAVFVDWLDAVRHKSLSGRSYLLRLRRPGSRSGATRDYEGFFYSVGIGGAPQVSIASLFGLSNKGVNFTMFSTPPWHGGNPEEAAYGLSYGIANGIGAPKSVPLFGATYTYFWRLGSFSVQRGLDGLLDVLSSIPGGLGDMADELYYDIEYAMDGEKILDQICGGHGPTLP